MATNEAYGFSGSLVTSEQLCSPMTSDNPQSPVTSDDRAKLLSTCWSRESLHQTGKVKSSIVDDKREVYTITDESLPSHMRSLLPSHEQQVHDLLTLERTRRRLRYVIIVLTILLALTVLVAVTLVFSLKVKPDRDSGYRNLYGMSSSSEKEMPDLAAQVEITLLDRDSRPQWALYRHEGGGGHRTPCLTECWTYAAFRFRSQCVNGLCQCKGADYDTLSCLPTVKGCNINRLSPSHSSAKLLGKNQTSYTCKTPARHQENVHVISIFGNHRSPTTHVTVKGQSASRDGILVLVTYHFVKWTVMLPQNSGIKKVFSLTTRRDWIDKTVVIEKADPSQEVTSSQEPEAEIFYRLSLTGYGEDKNGGHTPQLLHFINDEIGRVTSFVGAPHADDITIDLDDAEAAGIQTTTSESF